MSKYSLSSDLGLSDSEKDAEVQTHSLRDVSTSIDLGDLAFEHRNKDFTSAIVNNDTLFSGSGVRSHKKFHSDPIKISSPATSNLSSLSGIIPLPSMKSKTDYNTKIDKMIDGNDLEMFIPTADNSTTSMNAPDFESEGNFSLVDRVKDYKALHLSQLSSSGISGMKRSDSSISEKSAVISSVESEDVSKVIPRQLKKKTQNDDSDSSALSGLDDIDASDIGLHLNVDSAPAQMRNSRRLSTSDLGPERPLSIDDLSNTFKSQSRRLSMESASNRKYVADWERRLAVQSGKSAVNEEKLGDLELILSHLHSSVRDKESALFDRIKSSGFARYYRGNENDSEFPFSSVPFAGGLRYLNHSAPADPKNACHTCGDGGHIASECKEEVLGISLLLHHHVDFEHLRRCTYCLSPGHFMGRCPYSRGCFVCAESGHMWYMCPSIEGLRRDICDMGSGKQAGTSIEPLLPRLYGRPGAMLAGPAEFVGRVMQSAPPRLSSGCVEFASRLPQFAAVGETCCPLCLSPNHGGGACPKGLQDLSSMRCFVCGGRGHAACGGAGLVDERAQLSAGLDREALLRSLDAMKTSKDKNKPNSHLLMPSRLYIAPDGSGKTLLSPRQLPVHLDASQKLMASVPQVIEVLRVFRMEEARLYEGILGREALVGLLADGSGVEGLKEFVRFALDYQKVKDIFQSFVEDDDDEVDDNSSEVDHDESESVGEVVESSKFSLASFTKPTTITMDSDDDDVLPKASTQRSPSGEESVDEESDEESPIPLPPSVINDSLKDKTSTPSKKETSAPSKDKAGRVKEFLSRLSALSDEEDPDAAEVVSLGLSELDDTDLDMDIILEAYSEAKEVRLAQESLKAEAHSSESESESPHMDENVSSSGGSEVEKERFATPENPFKDISAESIRLYLSDPCASVPSVPHSAAFTECFRKRLCDLISGVPFSESFPDNKSLDPYSRANTSLPRGAAGRAASEQSYFGDSDGEEAEYGSIVRKKGKGKSLKGNSKRYEAPSSPSSSSSSEEIGSESVYELRVKAYNKALDRAAAGLAPASKGKANEVHFDYGSYNESIKATVDAKNKQTNSHSDNVPEVSPLSDVDLSASEKATPYAAFAESHYRNVDYRGKHLDPLAKPFLPSPSVEERKKMEKDEEKSRENDFLYRWRTSGLFHSQLFLDANPYLVSDAHIAPYARSYAQGAPILSTSADFDENTPPQQLNLMSLGHRQSPRLAELRRALATARRTGSEAPIVALLPAQYRRALLRNPFCPNSLPVGHRPMEPSSARLLQPDEHFSPWDPAAVRALRSSTRVSACAICHVESGTAGESSVMKGKGRDRAPVAPHTTQNCPFARSLGEDAMVFIGERNAVQPGRLLRGQRTALEQILHQNGASPYAFVEKERGKPVLNVSSPSFYPGRAQKRPESVQLPGKTPSHTKFDSVSPVEKSALLKPASDRTPTAVHGSTPDDDISVYSVDSDMSVEIMELKPKSSASLKQVKLTGSKSESDEPELVSVTSKPSQRPTVQTPLSSSTTSKNAKGNPFASSLPSNFSKMKQREDIENLKRSNLKNHPSGGKNVSEKKGKNHNQKENRADSFPRSDQRANMKRSRVTYDSDDLPSDPEMIFPTGGNNKRNRPGQFFDEDDWDLDRMPKKMKGTFRNSQSGGGFPNTDRRVSFDRTSLFGNMGIFSPGAHADIESDVEEKRKPKVQNLTKVPVKNDSTLITGDNNRPAWYERDPAVAEARREILNSKDMSAKMKKTVLEQLRKDLKKKEKKKAKNRK